MARVRCPYCRHLPLLVLPSRDGSLRCGHCGDPLERVPLMRPWRSLAGALVVAGAVLAAQPQRLPRLLSPQAPPQAAPQAATQAAPQLADGPLGLPAQASSTAATGLVGFPADRLLQGLAEADRAWIPRAEDLPDGRTRYVYKRRAGEPELTIAQIRALIASPPSFQRERQAITGLLAELRRVGVRIELSEPRKRGAAGEWEPRQRTIRILPRVVGKGSREFAKVLNHEAIHVAQSCGVHGRLRSSPRPLGLGEQMPESLASVLQEPLYRHASATEQRLEREAYANQERLELGAALVRQHCLLE